MMIEKVILIGSVMLTLLSLVLIPRDKALRAQFVFLFVQLPTWILGLAVVEFGLLEYPYRELAIVNRTSFLFEYLVLPVICIHFLDYYPERSSATIRWSYLAGASLTLTATEVLLEHYTQLIKYTGWHWYWTWLSVSFIFWLTRKVVQWFFSSPK